MDTTSNPIGIMRREYYSRRIMPMHNIIEPTSDMPVGDVVGVPSDAKTVRKGGADLWFAYDQGSISKNGREYLNIICRHHLLQNIPPFPERACLQRVAAADRSAKVP